jgi:isoleucyl-tRNA synthetase
MAEDKKNKSEIAEREEATLKFWQENNIFQKTLKKPSPKGEFVFYDGPPFATGQPHYGHILPGTMKDVIPRFKTMRGFHVPRVWGWDCHGLPIENLIEKELGLKSKKDIEEFGIEKFNDEARKAVRRYDADWKKVIPRTGRWIDMDLAYLTMSPTYSESIWWSFKTLHDKNLIYQSFKPMHICPHCETTLSNFEVTQNYKEITDISVYVKFELEDEPSTYVIAWTTTPWTLPGNMALAVGSEIEYVKLNIQSKENTPQHVIVSKELFEKVSNNPKHVLRESLGFVEGQGEFRPDEIFKGEKLVGKKYKPVFDYYKNADVKNKENIWKIVAADFVTTADGSGIVHIAPGYGEDDYNLSLKEKLPFIQHVGMDGKFKKEVTDFSGMAVKPKDTIENKNKHQEADVEIIKYLAAHNALVAKEKIVHSYPHCWRCDTPLLNYAATSWFVKVADLKDKLVSINKKINWVPPEIGEGRFGKWLEGAKDWAISRSRFWGAPIPVWICADCGKTEVIGSVQDLKKKTVSKNTYFVMRHGEAENNVKNILSALPDAPHQLTEKGKEQVHTAVKFLKKKKIDLIVSSDFVRAKETTDIIAKELAFDPEKIVYDPRLREYNFGDFNGQSIDSWRDYWKTRKWTDPENKVPGGESPREMQDRMYRAFEDLEKAYSGKTILVVSHDDPLRYALSLADGESITNVSKEKWYSYILKNAEVRVAEFSNLPRNKSHELDLHRPFIDEIVFDCSCGGIFKRVPEVFDTWYESGSMPYAQFHYPFENPKLIDEKIQFPADFIAEGQDQTRGWFYSLLVLSTGLFAESPYKNVIVNGIILAEDGQKMSKRLKNYPEINDVLDRYGADALRYYLLSSPAVRAEDLAFSEKGLDEVVKKIIMRLQNVYSFYEIYRKNQNEDEVEKELDRKNIKNVLDVWILSRLDELGAQITQSLEKYELDRAARPILDFIDDLSTWYLRRSRDRFKEDNEEDKQAALYTTRYVLIELSKIMAPFMPFLAEDLYQKVKRADGKESVHLENWSHFAEAPRDKPGEVIQEMQKVRDIVSLSLEQRAKANMKTRQPLPSLSINNSEVWGNEQYKKLIREEVNVKEIIRQVDMAELVKLDITITPELKEEGQAREFMRAVQELRKKEKLNPHDVVVLHVRAEGKSRELVEKFRESIMKTAQLSDIIFGTEKTEEKIEIDELSFKIGIEK